MIARIAAARVRRLRGDHDGFALVFTLLVITLVSIMVGGAITVATANIRPSVHTAYAQSAEAAAQAGLDAFLTKLNDPAYSASSCTGSTISAGNCTPSAAFSSTFTNDGGYTARYAVSAAGSTAWFRVTSIGTVSRGGEHATKTLTADMAGGASTNVRDYSAVTGYETQAPDAVAAQYPSRAIALPSSTARTAAGTSASSVTWNGATTSGIAGSVNTCNALYQGLDGRSHQGPPNTTTPYVDWSETGSAGTNVQPCQVSLGTQTQLIAAANPADGPGGYATRDALLLSNSYPGGSGPLLNQPVTTGYRYDAATATSCDKPGQDYRSFTLLCAGYPVDVGGAPRTGSQYSPRHSDTIPVVPTAAPTVPGTGSCVYSGPTRVRLNSDGTATITSPYTTSAAAGSPAGCYPSSLSGGIFLWTTPALSSIAGFNGVISVIGKGSAPGRSFGASYTSTGWKKTGQKATSTLTSANTVFYKSSGAVPTAAPDPTGSYSLETGCGATPYNSGATATCAWTNLNSVTDGNGGGGNGWKSYTAGTGCSSSLASTDRLAFECDFNGGSVGTPHDYYGIFRNRIEIDLSRSTCLSGTLATQQSCIQTFLTNELNPANTSTHRYLVSGVTPVDDTSSKTVSTNAAPLGGDPFFDSTTSPGTPTTESLHTTRFTFTVSRQVNKCYGVVVLGQCLLNAEGPVLGNQWGSETAAGASTPQFTVTTTNQTASLSSAGTSGVSSFPYQVDVTQYATASDSNNAPGDLYVEGSTSKTIALVAANDAVITGPLGSSGSAAVELVARDDVRVYHPVSCTSPDVAAVNATDAGFCPNDITGLYAGVPATAVRPDQQYANLRPDLRDLSVNGIVFALGNMVSSLPCPQPLSGGPGVCGGQFGVDNYDRGGGVGTLSVTGTLVMAHHGPVGREWEIADTTGQGSRPNSGYQLRLAYQNLAATIDANASVGGVVSGVTTTSSKWHVISVSTGGS